jgi:hypothetical protein
VIARRASLVVSLVSVIPRRSRDGARAYAPRRIALARSLCDASGINSSNYNTEDHVSEMQACKIKNVLKRGTQERTNPEQMEKNRELRVRGWRPSGR